MCIVSYGMSLCQCGRFDFFYEAADDIFRDRLGTLAILFQYRFQRRFQVDQFDAGTVVPVEPNR